MLNYTVVNGYGRAKNILWTYDGILTENEAYDMQSNAGYAPQGYGFYRYNVSNGHTTWLSSNKC